MADILVDSNVILDVATEDPRWFGWSSRQLQGLAERHTLVINPVIYAEVSVGFERIEDLDATLPTDFFRREPLPWAAGFLAGHLLIMGQAGFLDHDETVKGMTLFAREVYPRLKELPALAVA